MARRRTPPPAPLAVAVAALPGCDGGTAPWLAAIGAVGLIVTIAVAVVSSRRASARAEIDPGVELALAAPATSPSIATTSASAAALPAHVPPARAARAPFDADASSPHDRIEPTADELRDLELARHVQRRMSPQGLVRVPGFAVSGYAQMVGAVGGDWWSCHPLPDGRLLLAAGDVTGHGLPAALVAVLARGIVEGIARSLPEPSPVRVVATLADAIDELGDAERGMTCCVIVLDPTTGAIEVASAGHPFPYIRRAGGALEVVTARGAPLGGPAPSIGAARARLDPGDLLVLCSDGLADRAGADGSRFGERRLRRLLTDHAPEPNTGVRRLRAEIVGALRGFADTVRPDDDLTLIVCEFRERIVAGEPVAIAPLPVVVARDDAADTQPIRRSLYGSD